MTTVAGFAPMTVDFNSTGSTMPGGIDQYLWNFGEGAGESPNSASPSHTYSTPGTFTASLRVRDAVSGAFSAYVYTTVIVASPAAVTVGDRVAWTLTDPTGATPATYSWQINPAQASLNYSKSPVYQISGGGTNAQENVIFEVQDAQQKLSFSGTVLTEEQYNEMILWFNKGNELLLTDDLGRGFVVYISNFSFQRKRSNDFPWYHTFSGEFLVVNAPPSHGTTYSTWSYTSPVTFSATTGGPAFGSFPGLPASPSGNAVSVAITFEITTDGTGAPVWSFAMPIAGTWSGLGASSSPPYNYVTTDGGSSICVVGYGTGAGGMGGGHGVFDATGMHVSDGVQTLQFTPSVTVSAVDLISYVTGLSVSSPVYGISLVGVTPTSGLRACAGRINSISVTYGTSY